MLNMIKMDIYRMFRTKSLYVIWIIMAAAVIFTTCMSKIDYDMAPEETNEQQMAQEAQEEPVNLGMEVMLPTEPGETVTVYDLFYANTQAKFIALFLVIFAVLFGTADVNSGYIKNIGGQVRNRGHLVIAKMVSLMVYTILSMAGYILFQVIANQVIFGKIELGNAKEFFLYLGAQTALHYALVIISMVIALVIRSNAVSMVIVICLCMNMMIILYSAADNLIHKAGIKDFQLIKYTVTGKIAMLPMELTGNECVQAAVVSLGFIIVMMLAGSTIFRKRDI